MEALSIFFFGGVGGYLLGRYIARKQYADYNRDTSPVHIGGLTIISPALILMPYFTSGGGQHGVTTAISSAVVAVIVFSIVKRRTLKLLASSELSAHAAKNGGISAANPATASIFCEEIVKTYRNIKSQYPNLGKHRLYAMVTEVAEGGNPNLVSDTSKHIAESSSSLRDVAIKLLMLNFYRETGRSMEDGVPGERRVEIGEAVGRSIPESY